MKLGIFGGTFNPIHFGHLRVAEETRELAGLDRVLFMPSGNPPLKSADLASAADRFEMTRLATENNPAFEVTDIECRSSRKSYTADTLKGLKELYPSDDIHFILGIDAFLDLPRWYQPDRICTLADFILLSRPGYQFSMLSGSPFLSAKASDLRKLDSGNMESHSFMMKSGRKALLLNVSTLDISATDIRTRIKQGRSVKYLLPAEVEYFIISHKLYEQKKPKDRAVKRGCH